MLFQTPEFLVLFIVAVAGVALARRNSQMHAFITVVSYVFYAWLDVRFLILLLITSVVDFVAALGMDDAPLPWRRRWKLSAFIVAMTALTLGPNWQLLQGAAWKDASWSFDTLLQPLLVGDWVFRAEGSELPKTFAAWWSIAACVAFAATWPLVYEWLCRRYQGEARRKAFLIASVVCNLAVLGFFKYFNFFVDGIAKATASMGWSFDRPHLEVLLPMGISFYTFVSMSYTIDAFRRDLRPERSFLRFTLFVCYFPHLVAGPIIRPENFLPTLTERWRFSGPRVISGFNLALNGLFKKVLIADSVGPLADSLLASPSTNGTPSLAIMFGSFLFAVQIYCDFSGYSDIARGVSRIFGPELPINFSYPYFSTSIIDFWRTWHISLSTWLRDYLYIPLGGGRVHPSRVYFNLMATMILGGLWHGASANFLLWGFYQGGLLCLNRWLRSALERLPRISSFLSSRFGSVLRWVCTFYLVCLGWLIFRVNNPADPFDFKDLSYALRKFLVFDGNLSLGSLGFGTKSPFLVAAWVLLFAVFHYFSWRRGPMHERMDRWSALRLGTVYALLGAAFFFFWPTESGTFIYFQF
jgi:D-alanyl-lipoteichoic acid acyltransferase DltB (MBOAT superfamily)